MKSRKPKYKIGDIFTYKSKFKLYKNIKDTVWVIVSMQPYVNLIPCTYRLSTNNIITENDLGAFLYHYINLDLSISEKDLSNKRN